MTCGFILLLLVGSAETRDADIRSQQSGALKAAFDDERCSTQRETETDSVNFALAAMFRHEDT